MPRGVLPAWIVAAAMFGSAQAATFAVDTTLDSLDAAPGDGTCADADGHCSLRAAIQETNARAGADTIVLGAGTYAFTIPGSDEDAAASGDLDIDDDLVLQGAGAAATVIDANALDGVIDVRPAEGPREVRIEGLTLRNGWLQSGSQAPSSRHGAGLRVGPGAHVVLAHVDVRDNHLTAFIGAAGIDNSGCLEGHHVRVVGNRDPAPVGAAHAYAGGVATTGETGCLVLEDSEISDNRADYGGAMTVDGFAPVLLRRTLVANNTARFSGALHLNHGTLVRLESVTISGNAGNPGAILNDGGTVLQIVDSTITGNHASGPGANVGGIQDVHGGFGRTELTNTILHGNGPGSLADDCSNAHSGGGGNVIGDAAHCHYQAGDGDQLDVDPGLGPLADNGGFTRTHLPGPNAIDRGAATCGATDQRGVQRPLDGDDDGQSACDAGAVEVGDADVLFIDGFEEARRRRAGGDDGSPRRSRRAHSSAARRHGRAGGGLAHHPWQPGHRFRVRVVETHDGYPHAAATATSHRPRRSGTSRGSARRDLRRDVDRRYGRHLAR